MKKVWKVTTALNEQENKEFMTSMSEEDHTLVSGLELDLSVDVIENEKITSFVVCNELNLEKLKSLLMKHNVEFTVDDTTEFFVNEEVKVEDLSDDYIYEKLGI